MNNFDVFCYFLLQMRSDGALIIFKIIFIKKKKFRGIFVDVFHMVFNIKYTFWGYNKPC